MKRSRFTQEQVIGVLKENQAGVSVRLVPQARHQRRACALVGLAPRTDQYASLRADDADDADVRVRLQVLASEQRRFGYRRLHILGATQTPLGRTKVKAVDVFFGLKPLVPS